MLSLQEFKSLSNAAKSNRIRNEYPVTKESLLNRRPVFGVGINDADYVISPQLDGVRLVCPAYRLWAAMLTRSYSSKFHDENPTYIGVTVCKKWHSFMSFRDWWIKNQVDQYQLDKDLIGDSREYSPESCIFVPQWLNTFTSSGAAKRGSLPIGVSFHGPSGKYQSHCSHPFGKHKNLGSFPSSSEAHSAWKSRKLEIAEELRPLMDKIDFRIYQRVIDIIKKLQ